ncbi:hypothetical protein VNI00_018589 [Paramarasmius palmivorus]|uniref:Bacteriophage T5 Orf172 DNA-binding domain-containing protein n=1 Tax=Paramarasmius palmivorus TaxID=297713 RepID=A0AAW0AWG2_9AGAR
MCVPHTLKTFIVVVSGAQSTAIFCTRSRPHNDYILTLPQPNSSSALFGHNFIQLHPTSSSVLPFFPMVSLVLVASSAIFRNRGLSLLSQLLDFFQILGKLVLFALFHPTIFWRRFGLSYTICRSLNSAGWAIFEAKVRAPLHDHEGPGFVYAFRVDDQLNAIQQTKIGCTVNILLTWNRSKAHLARFVVRPVSANSVRYHYKTETLVHLLFSQHRAVGHCIEPTCNTSHREYFVLADNLQDQIHDIVAIVDAFLTVYRRA